MTVLASLWLCTMLTGEEGVTLRESALANNNTQNRLHLVIRGKIKANKTDETVNGQALLEYAEQVLDRDDMGLAKRVVRHYTDARAKFVVGTAEDIRQVRPNLRVVVGECGDKLTLWSPSGPFTNDERELIEEVFNPSRLAGLLPTEPVKVGGKWKPTSAVFGQLCTIENIVSCDVTGTLVNVQGNKANLTLSGVVKGLTFGAEIKSTIEAQLVYNTQTDLIEQTQWKQLDSRGPNPISPAGDFEVTITVNRTAGENPGLTKIDRKLLEPNPACQLVAFDSPTGKYRLHYDRNWHVTAFRPELIVMRRMVDSQLIAQLNIATLGDRPAGTAMSAEQFQNLIKSNKLFQIEQLLPIADIPTDGSFSLKLLTATGNAGDLKVIHKNYLATSPQGNQVLMTFICEAEKEEALATQDLSLVGTLEFAAGAAAKTPAAPK